LITAQIEPIDACWEELSQIFPVHHAELALFQDRMPLCPQRDEYFRRGRDGSLFLVTLRWDSRIVAYYIAQCQPGFHYGSTLTGTLDIFYVIPEVRQKG